MRDAPYLLLDVSDGIATVSLNRPRAYNALKIALLKELDGLLNRLEEDAAVRAIIITGSGDKAFAAGADIKEFSEFTPAQAEEMARFGQGLLLRIERFPKPVVAAVNGFALGGGCELAMACHFRTASENAKFGQPEIGLGIIPGYGGTQRLPRLIGWGRAMEMLMRGHAIDARTALAWGLVNHVFSQEALLPRTRELVQEIVQYSPLPLQKIIQAVAEGEDDLERGLTAEAALFAASFATEDFKEGVSAFLQRRKPAFKGR